ncbi:hypothetical protein GWK08_15995 [Leptobacterium flavescens]|uniref:Uncharacterized protein n=1 Tax=Leptobacterium flavescens TaxID=472055 RepID=A0A6P0UT10_9FLAO|nr:hypothetical protein [Leptobacterium flavescens]NER14959.1 hypothetical protein [Leptobacterium flavescens]
MIKVSNKLLCYSGLWVSGYFTSFYTLYLLRIDGAIISAFRELLTLPAFGIAVTVFILVLRNMIRERKVFDKWVVAGLVLAVINLSFVILSFLNVL